MKTLNEQVTRIKQMMGINESVFGTRQAEV
jgi:hypothetical protein